MQAESIKPLLISPDQAAEMLGLDQVAKNPSTVVLRLARDGELRKRRIGKFVLIERQSVEELVARR